MTDVQIEATFGRYSVFQRIGFWFLFF
uniref:Uncharacterized protein n=1 Tax=Arundo donax TaxID=35708 RepID=A0A0A8YLY4_ARUDO